MLGVGADGSVVIRLSADDKALLAGLARDSSAVKGFGERIKAQSVAMGQVGSTLTRRITLPIAGIAAASTKMAYDYESAMQRIQGLNRQSAANMALYNRQVLAMAKQVGQSPKQLAEALYFVTSSGFEGAQALKVLRASAKGAAIGLGDTQVVADALTSVINAYGAKNISAARAVDIMTAAIRVGKMEPAEMAQSIGDVVSTAAQMKVEFADLTGALAAMTLKGVNTAESVTALNNFMMGLNKGTQEGAKYLDSMGTSYADLRQELATKGLIPTMRTIQKLTKGNSEALVDIIPNIRSMKAFWNLLSGDGKQLAQVFKDVKKSGGDLDTAFGDWSKSKPGQMKKALASLQTSAVQLGQTLLPIVVDVVNHIARMVEAFNALPKSTKTIIAWAAAVAAALGPVLVGLSGIAKFAGGIGKMFGKGAPKVAAGGAGAAAGVLGNLGKLVGPLAITATVVTIAAKAINDYKRPEGPEAGARGGKGGGYPTATGNAPELPLHVKVLNDDVQSAINRIIAQTNKVIAIKVKIEDKKSEIETTKQEIKDLKELASKGFDVKADIKAARQRLRELKGDISDLRHQKAEVTAKFNGKAFALAVEAARRKLRATVDAKYQATITALIDQGSYQTAARMLAKLGTPITKTVSVVYGKGANPYPTWPQASGGDYQVTKPTLFLAGEAGPERATFTPMGKSAPASTTSGSPTFSNCTFIGSPPESWADFVRMHAADIMEMGFEEQDSYSRALARGMA